MIDFDEIKMLVKFEIHKRRIELAKYINVKAVKLSDLVMPLKLTMEDQEDLWAYAMSRDETMKKHINAILKDESTRTNRSHYSPFDDESYKRAFHKPLRTDERVSHESADDDDTPMGFGFKD